MTCYTHIVTRSNHVCKKTMFQERKLQKYFSKYQFHKKFFNC